jgi:hypothetical protein
MLRIYIENGVGGWHFSDQQPPPQSHNQQIRNYWTGMQILTNQNTGKFGESLTTITTASQWFCAKFPSTAKIKGAPFLENSSISDGSCVINPVAPNIDFFAACLGGESAKEVIYWGSECMFYYLEPIENCYYPVPDSKLGDLMRGWFAKAAQELQKDINVYHLFVTFRTNQVINQIVEKAKSVLLASEDFFSPTSPYQRRNGIEVHERLARVFVEKMLVVKPSEMVLVAPAYEKYIKLAKERDLLPIKRSHFKEMIKPLIRERFNAGLRCDLMVNGRYQVGWKGVGLNLDAALS